MTVELILGDCLTSLKLLPDNYVQCVVTSPPYWGLRDYGVDGQIGLEPTPDEYVSKMVDVFREVRRVLKDDGVLWLNLGDSYFGSSMTGGTGSYESQYKREARMFNKQKS
ncbi:MAG: site-specific DNA-methyltransferase, partial [Chloroflexi bacterium]|nr:site-specific DNA-methyltransferase [Chloroflexota bacterium]